MNSFLTCPMRWARRFGIALAILIGAVQGVCAEDKFANIHSVAIVSTLGNVVDMQTQGTRFDYDDFKLHTDWNLDGFVRDYITKALQARFTVKDSNIDPQTFSNIESYLFHTVRAQIGDRLRALKSKPDVDALIVVFPFGLDSTGYVSPGLAATHASSFLNREGGVTVAATYSVGVYDAKTGELIDYTYAQYSGLENRYGGPPPIESCPDSMWAPSEDQLNNDQRDRIRQEFQSLLTHSLPITMAKINLITKADALALAASSTVAGDPSCEAL